MPATHPRLLGLLTTAVVAFAAVWCCCVPAVAATRVAKSCCDAPAHPDRTRCPTHDAPVDGCPMIKLRQTMPLPTPTVTPPGLDVSTPLADSVTTPVLVPAVVTNAVADRPASATGPPTLLALHTSLLW